MYTQFVARRGLAKLKYKAKVGKELTRLRVEEMKKSLKMMNENRGRVGVYT